MTITALSLALTVLAANPHATKANPDPPVAAARTFGAAELVPDRMPVSGIAKPRWMVDAPEKRPAALPALYATFGALQMADAYSTRRAVTAGAIEANPLMKAASGGTGTMFAVKAASAAGSIYLAERLWKKNRKGAVILMAVVNGITAAVVTKNLRNAR
jgi:hypothetical protein